MTAGQSLPDDGLGDHHPVNHDIPGSLPMQPKDWKMVVEKHFPRLVPVVEACLANVCALLLKDLSNCPALVLVGPPSSIKTTALDFLDGDLIYESDNFTPASFVSHAANVTKDNLSEIDLLPRLRKKVLVSKDLSPIFSKREEDLQQQIGILTRVLDGRGYQSDSGVHGKRGYQGDYRFAFLAATTQPDGKVWKVMSRLGPRLLWLVIEPPHQTVEEQVKIMQDDTGYLDKIEVCRQAVSGYLMNLWNRMGKFGGVVWNRQGDNENLLKDIIGLANLGSYLRAQTVKDRAGEESGAYTYSPAIVEGPDRYRSLLYNLARGHAIAEGRSSLESDDILLAANVTLSSAPEERRRLLWTLLVSQEPITIERAAEAINCSLPTARAIAREMGSLHLVDGQKETDGIKLCLPQGLNWLKGVTEAYRRRPSYGPR
jgi:hypothetical protein